MKNLRNISIVSIIFLCLFFSMNSASAQISLEDISIDPVEPEPQSTITITATFSNYDEVTNVNIKVKECRDVVPVVCFSEQNKTMVGEGSGVYTVTLTLNEEQATYIQYSFEVSSGDTFETLSDEDNWKYDLKTSTDNGGNGGSDDNNTPGFEILVALAAIAILSIIIKRKRL